MSWILWTRNFQVSAEVDIKKKKRTRWWGCLAMKNSLPTKIDSDEGTRDWGKWLGEICGEGCDCRIAVLCCAVTDECVLYYGDLLGLWTWSFYASLCWMGRKFMFMYITLRSWFLQANMAIWQLNTDVQALQDEILTIKHSQWDKFPSSIALQSLTKFFCHYFSASNWTSKHWYKEISLGIFLLVYWEEF